MTDKTCEICFDESDNVVKLEGCEHSFCKECFVETYRSMIEDQNAFDKLKCPQHGCETLATEKDIQNIVSVDVFEKYKRFMNNKRVASDPNLIFCPKPNCETVISLNQSIGKTLKCPGCQYKFCKKCKQDPHRLKSCQKAIDKGLEDYISSKSGTILHNCPKCGALCEKNGGCPQMNCSICGHQYCWTCGFPREHWFHHIQMSNETGVICELYNSFVVRKSQPGITCEILCFIIYAIIFVAIVPSLALALLVSIGPLYLAIIKPLFYYRLESRHLRPQVQKILTNVIVFLRFNWYMFRFLLSFVLYLALASIIGVLAFVMFYIFIIIIIPIVILQNCLKCRKIGHNNSQLQQLYENKRTRNLAKLEREKKQKIERDIENQPQDQIEREIVVVDLPFDPPTIEHSRFEVRVHSAPNN